ncbi:hypothetical protein [Saccharibacillus sp. JS10]|uniref:hypothetical protein n=1 Tax=Saccharibacillus sp. JS10 TaxID=2950552 RepID=UPI00210A3F06|nr:hypothetical protein [Saccharibacillus sp. JS10]MCQ4087541.1 hypothetical protein [Saccharibacillus sp. JS10]
MYVNEKEAKQLKNLEFKRSFYVDEVAPFDMYSYQGQEWCLGGRIVPEGNILAEGNIYTEGEWRPNIYDLMYWLENRNYQFSLSYNHKSLGYLIEIFDEKEGVVKAKGADPINALCKIVIKLLESENENDKN